MRRKLVCMKSLFEEYIERPHRYDNIDGTGEIRMGLMILGCALAYSLRPSGTGPFLGNAEVFANVLMFFGVCLPPVALGYILRKFIKKHVTWPRTGYVAYNDQNIDPGAKQRLPIRLLVIISIVGLLVPVLSSQGEGKSSIPAAVAYSVAAGFFVVPSVLWERNMGGPYRWKWILLPVTIAGAFIIYFHASFWEAMGAMMWFIGVVWLVSGITTLLLFLRNAQAPASGER